MSITYKNFISPSDYNSLRECVGWGRLPLEQAQAGLKGSTFIVVACDEELAVGTARVLYDGGDAALIKDVIVAPDYQRQGIGLEMMTRIMNFLREQLKPNWGMQIDLTSTKGKEPFYRKFGFELRPNEKYGNGMVIQIKRD